MTRKDALQTRQQAAEVLGLQEGELDEAISAGELRVVYHRPAPDAPLESYVLGEDVRRLRRESDPQYLARMVGRPGRGAPLTDDDDDDEDSPRNLARAVPRL